MGITLHREGDREYYRVTKAWGGKEIQKYVRIGRDRQKALQKARQMDENLEQRKRAASLLRRMEGVGVMHDDGRVTGLQILRRTRSGRVAWLEFKIRVKELGKPARFKTVSVQSHGLIGAFELAIRRICELREIEIGSEIHQRMLAARWIYLEEAERLMEEYPDLVSLLQQDVENRKVNWVEPSSLVTHSPESKLTGDYGQVEMALESARREFINKQLIRG